MTTSTCHKVNIYQVHVSEEEYKRLIADIAEVIYDLACMEPEISDASFVKNLPHDHQSKRKSLSKEGGAYAS